MRVFLVFLFCVTVYFNDGSFQCFKEAKDYSTDVDWFHAATEYRILDSPYNLMGGYNIIARIPFKNVRFITKECK